MQPSIENFGRKIAPIKVLLCFVTKSLVCPAQLQQMFQEESSQMTWAWKRPRETNTSDTGDSPISSQLNLKSIGSYDIVLSTYGTVAADLARNRGLLNQTHWYRIVLDEAHVIRNWSTKQFHAIHQLSARSHWCMTGTPIQNSLEDLGTLIRFIRLPSLEEPYKFRRHIVGGIKVAGQLVGSNFGNLRDLLSVVCIRRPNSLLALPGIEFQECRPVLSLAERIQYNVLVKGCHQAIEKSLYRGKDQNDAYGVLESLLRLRLFCNGGVTTLQLEECSLSPNDKTLSLLQQNEDASCSYCRFSEETSKLAHCPVCVGAESDHLPEALPAKVIFSAQTDRPSSKIAALLDNIRKEPTSEKCLIFSFWKKTLDSVSDALDKNDIRHARVDGSLAQFQRKKALQTFRNHEETRVLLVTFGTGSTGLNNLCIATRIHIFEPQWNPTVESQAIGRLFRHGQTNKAVESRQLRKVELAHRGGLHGSRNDRSQVKTRFMALSILVLTCIESWLRSPQGQTRTYDPSLAQIFGETRWQRFKEPQPFGTSVVYVDGRKDDNLNTADALRIIERQSDARLEPLVLASITLVLAYDLYHFALKTSDVPEISILNARKGGSFPCLRAVWTNRTYLIFGLLPAVESRRLIDQPEGVFSVAYAQAIPVSAQVLTLLPRPLHHLVAPLITRPNRKQDNPWSRVVRPEIERRLNEYEDDERHPESQRTQAPNDFLQWTLSTRLLLLNAASFHASAFDITHIILDLVGSGKPEYIENFREEICGMLAKHGDQWDRRALAQMHKLDSVFRESQQLNSVLTIGPLKIFNAKNAVITPSGVFVLKWYQVWIPAFKNHIDTKTLRT
ncbi:hypothetical protein LA080_013505 [Diaporthe eres]|nr:hypothetical protein LA080_013505 [Diaporthe eres]